MSGHSKWATTKHKKAAIDAKRGKLFAKLIKNIEVAARVGGGDVGGNPTLFDAIQKAKKSSVPNDNIDRAVKRGSGEGADAVDYQTIMYEATAPTASPCWSSASRTTRTGPPPRCASRSPATAARWRTPARSPTSSPASLVVVPKADGVGEDEVMMAALEAGAEEVTDEGDAIEVLCEATDLVAVRTAIQDAGIDYDSADVIFHPSMEVEVDAEGARKILRLIDALEDSDDVQNVYANFNASDDVMAELEDD